IAFDEQGHKKWEFTSEMDSAVYETGKQYWFKSAFPGIYGLYSGYFDNGKSRAFVGSACTLEILDENGQLVKRLPVFWSVIRQFLMTTAKDGSKNLLVGGWLNGFNQLVAIGGKEIEEVARGYDEFPPGNSSIKGFAVMNRYDNFLTDLNHDGRQEVISAINGSWNRVSIYSEDGKPLFNAQFGPGPSTPRSTMRMMDVGDLLGDGKPEIIVGIASGKIVVLNGQAQKLWAIALSSPPTVIKLVKDRDKNWVCIGSEDGTIVAMDGHGNILKQGKVTGRPLDIQVLKEPNRVVVIIDDQGKINGFTLD
ncbi:MAG: VCBS repeat-containing protein, partial [Ginsengibacter sp.]